MVIENVIIYAAIIDNTFKILTEKISVPSQNIGKIFRKLGSLGRHLRSAFLT